MILLWLLDAALLIAGWLLSLFSFLPVLDLPEGPDIVIPVPALGSSGVAMLNTWIGVAKPVIAGLIVGSILQWIYRVIPFKSA